MNNKHHIVPAHIRDAAEIARLSIELGYPATVDQIRNNLAQILQSSKYFVAVAPVTDDQLLGWIVAERRVSLESGESLEITGLVVSSSARCAGIGKALVASVEQWATHQGFTSIRVRSNVTRAESHSFYQRIGFMPKKTQHTYEKSLPSAGPRRPD